MNGLVDPTVMISGPLDIDGDSLVEQIGDMWGVNDQRERLHDKLLSVQAVLANAEEQGAANTAVRFWLCKLRSAAYEADDVLDDFRYDQLRRDAVKAGQYNRIVFDFFSGDNPVLFRYKMNKKLKNVVGRIDELVTEMSTFRFIQGVQEPSVQRHRTHSFVEASEVVGRDEDKEGLIRSLLDVSICENIKILPIVGMGGLGKTTLAQLVCNDLRVKHHFEMPLWVCVSDDFNVGSLAKSIIDLVKRGNCELPEDNMELLQIRLREVLSEKRYLLVLDDVWNEDFDKWEQLKALLGCGSHGSAIIVTTRSKRVASIMGTRNSCILTELVIDDLWTVFKRRAFGSGVQECEELVKIGMKMVERCGGSPLAAKALGALVSSKHHVREWMVILDQNEIWNNLFGENKVLAVLKLSYDHLPPYVKQCFAFCGFYPKDYEMEKDTMVHIWMANGFIPRDGNTSLEVKGTEIFNELLWGSFFQETNQVRRDMHGEFGYMDITKFKMHDLMHDLAQSVSRNENKILLESIGFDGSSSKDVRNLLMKEYRKVNMDDVSRSFPYIRILHVDNWRLREAFGRLSKKNSMRVILLPNCSILFEVSYMRHMRYLDLSHGGFEILSEEITTLYNLEILNLSNCYRLYQLPSGMRYMVSLRHLYLYGCRELRYTPARLGNLRGLQTLTKYFVSNKIGCSIGEIKNLNLGGTLELFNLKVVRNAASAKEANMCSKSNLDILLLNWGIYDHRDGLSDDCEALDHRDGLSDNCKEIMEALAPHNGLKVLKISYYCDYEFPAWMSNYNVLNNLIELHLVHCEIRFFPAVWQLPYLQILVLCHLDNLTQICSSASMDNNKEENASFIFPTLKKLVLHNLHSLERWEENKGKETKLLVFPQLHELQIQNCPKLIGIPKLPSVRSINIVCAPMISFSSITHITTLCSLSITNPTHIEVANTSNVDLNPICVNKEVTTFRPPASLERLYMAGMENLVPPEMDEDVNFKPSLHNLKIRSCNCFFSSRVSQLPLKFWIYFSFLERLTLVGCSVVVFWPEKEFQSLRCLKKLYIESFSNLTGSSSTTESTTPFDQELLPQLEKLSFEDCPCLVELPRCGTMFLKELSITSCNNIMLVTQRFDHLKYLKISMINRESILLNWEQFSSLETLVIDCCKELMSLPDNMKSLISLRVLHIRECRKIKSCSKELMQWLQGLEDLTLYNCPQLERKIRHVKNTGIWCSPFSV